MSTEQSSLDPHLIEQTKQQIRSLVNEIAQLTKEELAPEEFYGRFLTRVVSALAAVGGAVWTTNEEGRLSLQYQINLQQMKLGDSEEQQAQHGRLIYQCFRDAEGMLVPPHSGWEGNEQAGNPTDLLLVLGPLRTELEVVGVVEILQRPDAGPNTQKGYLRFLMQMCDLAADYLKSHQLRHFSDRQLLWTQLEDFTRVVHASLDPRETAYTIANEGRRLIGCDRVSIAFRRGSRCTVEAVSGQDMLDKRSNTVTLLGKLAAAVVATGEPVWYTGDTRDMPPQVEDAVQEYVDEAHSKTVAVLPLQRPKPEEEEEPGKADAPEPPFGALIVEQIEDSRVPQSMIQRVEVVSRHSCAALGNAMEHSNLFLMPLWRAIGKSRWLVQARTLPKTVAVAGAIVVGLALLFLYPADFELQSKGTLQPVQQHEVFARIDGVVTDLYVEHGAQVAAGQLLAELRNTDLDVNKEDVLGRLRTVSKQILSLRRQTNDPMTPKQRAELFGELASLDQQKASLKAQLDLYMEKTKDLKVLSPSDGQVVTWELERLLRRPVQRGQVLMRVADTSEDKDWELELNMPEDRMGHIAQAAGTFDDDLKVTYQLATDPGTSYEGTVREMHLSARIDDEQGNVVPIKVDITEADLPSLRPGATVNAKVYCGRRSIGYVWFHDLLTWFERVWFRWF